MNEKYPLVSIIIPIYNSEKYLNDCLTSVQQQTYDNYEVLMIDDGSMDSSKYIAMKFCENDDRFKLYTKQNGGVSSARNTGINLAKGEYILFIDSDDTIKENCIEFMLNGYKCNVDIVICNMSYLDEAGKEQGDISTSCLKNELINVDTSYKFQRSLQHLSACAVLYRYNSIGDRRFDTSLVIGEDALFHNSIFVNCRRALFLENKLYVYRMHQGSAFKTSFNKTRLTEIDAWNRIVDLYDIYPFAKRSAKGELAIRCMNIYKSIVVSDKIYKCYLKKVRKQYLANYDYIKDCKPGKKTRVEAFIFRFFPHIYKLLYFIKKRGI